MSEQPVREGAIDPRTCYVERLTLRRIREARLLRRERQARRARVSVFIPVAAIAFILYEKEATASYFLASFGVLFLVLLTIHQLLIRASVRARQAVAFYERGIARLEERWSATGETGIRYRDLVHAYAADLDLFGPESLFELVCMATTCEGERALVSQLLEPVFHEEVHERQEAVRALAPEIDLREQMAVLASGLTASADFLPLASVASPPPERAPRWVRGCGLLLAGLAVASLIAWAYHWVGPLPFLAMLALEAGYAWRLRPRVRRVLAVAERRGQELALLVGLLARIEDARFASRRLGTLTATLHALGGRPSRHVRRLRRLMDRLDWMRNPISAPLQALLLWNTSHALAIEAWLSDGRQSLVRWLSVVGEFEALCAVAGYAFEHPEDSFPEVVPEGPSFEAEGLGHPLLPQARCVRNDVHLNRDVRLLVVSGSNMSGKSTLLRTVGLNAVLAYAGAPVRARRLRLSALAIGATIRMEDSLQEGRSRFLSEILRLRKLVEMAGKLPPLLFLLDELLHGTNSHDRKLGAEGIVSSLLQRGAIGLVTTHDLALTQMVDRLGSQAVNMHFEDRLENGLVTFDYRMRPGVVTHSNALALMRAVGLRV